MSRPFLGLLLVAAAHAEIQLPSHLSSGAILQTWRGFHVATHLYGTAAPGELVTVAADVQGVPPFNALADASGAWSLAYNWPPGPTCWDNFDLTISGTETSQPITLAGVRWGDSVLCLGDEALELPLSASADASAWLAEAATVKALSYVRLFDPSAGTWTNASLPGAAARFSALCLRTAVAATATHGFGGNSVVGLLPLAAAGSAVEEWLPPAGVAAAAACPALPFPAASPPPAPGRLWAPALAQLPMRYFAIALGTADAPRMLLAPSLAEAAAAYACRLSALVLGLRDGAAVGDAPVVLLEPLPAATASRGALFALRAAMALLLPGASNSSSSSTQALALGSGYAANSPHTSDASNVTLLTQNSALALVYTAWWAFSLPAAGPRLSTMAPAGPSASSSALLTFAFAPGGVLDAGQLALVPSQSAPCSSSSAGGDCCSAPGAAFEWSAGGQGEGAWQPANSSVAEGGRGVLVTPATATAGQPPPQAVRYGAGSGDCVLVDAATGIPAPAFTATLASPAQQAVAGAVAVARPAAAAALAPAPAPAPASAPAAAQRVDAPLQEGVAARRQYLLDSHARRVAFRAAPPPASGMLAPTPPLYFNTWQAFRCNLDEGLLRRTADALVSTGLAAAGYTLLNMDDCEWRTARSNATGAVQPDETRFPSGMAALVAYLAAKAPPLTLGVYTSATSSTCVGRPGSYQHEAVDAATYCAWGAGFVKVDRCGGTAYPALNTSWLRMRAGLDAACSSARPALLSVESCGVHAGGSGADPACAAWIRSTGAQMFRTTTDMQLYWQSTMFNLDGNEPMAPLAGPGVWADPDMLNVGHPGLTEGEWVVCVCFVCARVLWGV